MKKNVFGSSKFTLCKEKKRVIRTNETRETDPCAALAQQRSTATSEALTVNGVITLQRRTTTPHYHRFTVRHLHSPGGR
jgi:hypothetical protein